MSSVGKWASVILGGLVLIMGGPSCALDPSRSLLQIHHTAWTMEDGAPPNVEALAQTPDGFLWLGTTFGLFRFDGVRFERVRTRGDQMPEIEVTALLATPSGDLWIGYKRGLVARLRDGKLQNMTAGLPTGGNVGLAKDNQNTVWVSLAGEGHPGLARFVNGRWEVIGRRWGLPEDGVRAFHASRDGALWVETKDELFLLRAGTRRFGPTGLAIRASFLAESPNGRLWASTDSRRDVQLPDLERNLDARLPDNLSSHYEPFRHAQILFDRDGSMWSTTGDGVTRINREAGAGAVGEGNRFSTANGLTSDVTGPLLEDREGNIWVGTALGLDRFGVANAFSPPRLPQNSPDGFWEATSSSGDVYVATEDQLFLAHPDRAAHLISSRSANDTFLFTDSNGVLWQGLVGGMVRLKGKHLVKVSLPPSAAGNVVFIGEDGDDRLWISVWGNGLFRQSGKTWEKIDISPYPNQPAPDQFAIDSHHRVWLDYHGHLFLLDGSNVHAYSERDGLSIGHIQSIAIGPKDILVGGDFGMARFDGRRFETLKSDQNPEFTRISGIVQTKRGDTWVNGSQGAVQVETSDLDWAFDHPGKPLRRQLFTLADGLPGVAQQSQDAPTVIEASDGRVWFVTNHGVAWIDPAHVVRNLLAPPVAIRSITTNGVEYPFSRDLRLPPGSANLQIDYTALSLSIPERVRFRYRLEGVDRDWIDPGPRRQAFYTNLNAGKHTFYVVAANNDGVWNNVAAVMHFRIMPTFLQSYWFYLCCAFLALGTLWVAYVLRLRQVTARIRDRAAARLAERERIARELHDTLLQGFQGLVLRFQAVADIMPSAHSARRLMEEALGRADKVLVEGRDRISDLRSTNWTQDLSEVFADVAETLALKPGVELREVVEGVRRPLNPVAAREICKIGNEALFNAAKHSNAKTIDVIIAYHSRALSIAFRDDGIGMNPELIAQGGRNGHYGLIGMRERAKTIGAQLVITSRVGGGTKISLVVPAEVAYADARTRKRFLFRLGGAPTREVQL